MESLIRGSLGALSLMFAAFSSSPTYQLQSYGINGAATNTSSSTTYRVEAASGQLTSVSSTSPTYTAKSGSIQAQQAYVPPAPTLSNGTNTYTNKLDIIINTGNNPTDATYAVAVSLDAFATTQYVQADGTLGASQVFQTYVQWGSGTGSVITGLTPATTYQAKVSAMQGNFTQSAYGPTASSATASANTITFSVSPNSVTLPSLLSATVVTSSSITTSLDTNATYGGTIYVLDTNAGLTSPIRSSTITSASADLSVATRGYGVRGVTATQTSGGPLSILSPYNGAVNNVGALSGTPAAIFRTSTAIVGGSATSVFHAKASSTDPAAADYADTVSFIAAASF